MHEEKFYLIEGKKMKLEELAKEIEAATGGELEDVQGSINRVVVKKPAPEEGFETFTITFKEKHTVDFIDAVVTTDNKKKNLEDYDFENSEFTVRLISYIRRDVPIQNEAEL
ncbi:MULTISPECIES: hypothetical protein [Jeotgalicoccus]|jgi:hypothetical protein|uniref:Uncharacterized protein n=1 Tax=Jeotgalicoccus nanhaiensis TaxID=568603 RepID=A0ABR9XZP5_9STAP|nr:hypothetical protein [Jeotgalicoccus nanhaiensis]MBF0754206.1 hypothetical protein [Jeotgalicoccus nanhaiensis]TFU61390.1 hypothetical protein E4T89_07935 [Jeotgalicoccus nanhaiensis]